MTSIDIFVNGKQYVIDCRNVRYVDECGREVSMNDDDLNVFWNDDNTLSAVIDALERER